MKMFNGGAISSYFSTNELKCKCGCGSFNYSKRFLNALSAFRCILKRPVIVTCGCRCKKHNAEVGGVPTSLHECTTKQASATDITLCRVEDVGFMYKEACNSRLFNEVIWYKAQRFVHVGIDPNQKGNYFSIK